MRNFNVKVNGKTFFVEVEEADGLQTAVRPESTTVMPDAKTNAPSAARQVKEAGSITVVSPFPGLILGLAVQDGATVSKNDKIVVLEAMKMQHDIVAGAEGKVVFLVKKGDTVETGTELAFIK